MRAICKETPYWYGLRKQKKNFNVAIRCTETVIRTLAGWKMTRLIAGKDGVGVVIYSEWESHAAVEAMRNDPRMKVYFPNIIELATLESIAGSAVLSETR